MRLRISKNILYKYYLILAQQYKKIFMSVLCMKILWNQSFFLKNECQVNERLVDFSIKLKREVCRYNIEVL